ncbi:NAD(+)/NADH kinase [Blastopirellula sp. JC732]|uniref:NAD(+)/NADH kinase n=1 Tax=Blastopirellula sediminis TaxID=2894196 RepID=A0A9X1MSW4_9BACT|nr:diacylglycerol kinase family protein [Blastopirellula sediminis]MCC9604809.1 NAD(+)/NADH kinase [Blastopirellula sediminis]MCC9631892.1 NAD(+)/NADH kinase [Blastopirellula sediminis]
MNFQPFPASEPGKIVLFYNPIAGPLHRHDKIDRLEARLRRLGHEVISATKLTDLETMVDPSVQLVISAGGDGTAAAAVARIGAEVPLAIFPTGTENVYGKYLGINNSTEAFVEFLSRAMICPMDAATANGRIFLLMAGIGYDAEVVHQVAAHRKGHMTQSAYFGPILQTTWSYPFPNLQLELENESGEIEQLAGKWAFVVNVPRYAWGMSFAPQAVPWDGLLDLCILPQGGLAPGIGYLYSIIRGGLDARRDVTYRRCRRIQITSDSVDVRFQTDGDPGGPLPVEIEVAPARFRCLVPREFAENHRQLAEDGAVL